MVFFFEEDEMRSLHRGKVSCVDTILGSQGSVSAEYPLYRTSCPHPYPLQRCHSPFKGFGEYIYTYFPLSTFV